jgi:DNA-binding NarL/FixJ family response regulator
VDDHAVVRDGLTHLLDAQPDMQVCGYAESAAEALRAVETLHPDFAIIDLTLEGPSGIELLKDLQIRFPKNSPSSCSRARRKSLRRAGAACRARGYLAKKKATETVLVAIPAHRGRRPLRERSIASKLLHRLIEQPDGSTALSALSDLELKVVPLISQGRGTRQIAEALHLSVKTVESHRHRITAS